MAKRKRNIDTLISAIADAQNAEEMTEKADLNALRTLIEVALTKDNSAL